MRADLQAPAYAYPPGSYKGPNLPTCGGCNMLRSKSARDGEGGRVYWCARAQTMHWHKSPVPIDVRSPACRSWEPRGRV